MAEIVGGLFGVTPEALQMQREKQSQQEALNFAQLQDPFARANYQIYQGASGLGRQISGLLGAQDPEMAKAAALQGILKQADTTSPEGLATLARTLAGQGFGQQALQVSQQAQGMMKTQSEISKNMREKAGADPVQQLLRTGKYTIPSLGNYEQSGNIADLVPIDPNDPTQITETAEGVVLVNKKTGEVVKRIGAPVERGTRTTVNVDAKGEAEFVKELGKIDAKKVGDAGVARDNALATVRSLNQLEKLDDQGLISGSFATGRVGATNLLNTLGLTSPTDQQRLASSQNYQKVAGDVILGVLGGKLGAGFSNEDRKFIESLVPQLETSAAARRQLITFMRDKNMSIADEATRLETYARDKKGLSGFQPKIPLGQNVPTSSMSADDLAKAAGGKIVNGKFVPNN
jgi:hypothetical protein